MPIRRLQKIPVFPAVVLSHPVEKVDDAGNCRVVRESDIAPLPDANNFSLDALLRAGQNIKRINTKCLGDSAAVASVIDYAENYKQPNKE